MKIEKTNDNKIFEDEFDFESLTKKSKIYFQNDILAKALNFSR